MELPFLEADVTEMPVIYLALAPACVALLWARVNPHVLNRDMSFLC
jgi:hypothetical protein